ncbi:MAG: hypothetical protein NWE93_06415 [Candidatus Bathyarchaeota archaeon]|nr:hypothetical protein [Candidatus Bathyarchaeota archaeon]
MVTKKSKYLKVLRILLLPVVLVAGLIGWCLIVIGDRWENRSSKKAKAEETEVKDDGVTFMVAPPEEEELETRG